MIALLVCLLVQMRPSKIDAVICPPDYTDYSVCRGNSCTVMCVETNSTNDNVGKSLEDDKPESTTLAKYFFTNLTNNLYNNSSVKM